MEQNLSLQSKQELTLSKIGELERFEIAIRQPKIIEASNEEIKQNLRYAMILVGIRAATINSMAEEEKLVLIEFLREKYPYHTAAELKIAFTKAAAHELDIKDVNHYENFTCEYIGRIMSAYRKWASYMNSQVQTKQIIAEYEQSNAAKIEYPPKDIVTSNFEAWKQMATKKVEYINPDCYDILLEYGYFNYDVEQRKEIYNEAKTIIFGYDMPANEKSAKMKDETYLTMLCKKVALGKLFNACIENNSDILLF